MKKPTTLLEAFGNDRDAMFEMMKSMKPLQVLYISNDGIPKIRDMTPQEKLIFQRKHIDGYEKAAN